MNTHKPVKLSEAIRNAVDIGLLHPDMVAEDQSTRYYQLKFPLGPVLSNPDFLELVGVFEYLFEDTSLSFKDCANIQFMYAEFLALEAEDAERLQHLHMLSKYDETGRHLYYE